jgi:hypothetical protein
MGMGGWRVGDQLSYRGETMKIVGFVLADDRSTAGDQSIEYALVRHPDGSERLREATDLNGCRPVYRGPDPFDRVQGWDLSQGWVDRFNHLLQPLPPEPDLALHAARLAQKDGDVALITGGTVRDALLGVTERHGDIDLVGTLRSPAFRDLAVDAELLPYGGRPGGPDDRWHLRTRGSERFVTVLSPDEASTVDYAPMRVDYRPHPLSDRKPVWVYGTTLAADARWRDVSCNALVYDPEVGRLYDPTDHGLRDLGLKTSDLHAEPPSSVRRDVTLRPVDLPENAPLRHVALHVARVVLLIVRFADGALDTGPAERWVEHHAEVIERALRYRDSAGDRLPLLTKELRSLPRAAGVPALIARHRKPLSRTFSAGGLWAQLEAVVPTLEMLRQGGRQQRIPRLVGSALREIEHAVDGQGATAATEVVGPSRPTRAALRKYFLDDLVGYEHAVDTVVVDGRVLTDVLVLRPDRDTPGVVYLELDDDQQPITPTEEELARIRRRDGTGS